MILDRSLKSNRRDAETQKAVAMLAMTKKFKQTKLCGVASLRDNLAI
jgi:hypothetical protein